MRRLAPPLPGRRYGASAGASFALRPADYPPPRAEVVVAPPSDAEPIEVGVCIVGAGPAGLACAIRLGQLLADDPATAERLGEVPVVVVEKGKQPGAHLLSGAVVNPRALTRLFAGRRSIAELPLLGRVEDERVYLLGSRRAQPIPTPPTMRNRGNYLASLSQLGRFLAREAEQGGATILSETTASRLLVQDGRVAGVRSGDRGRARDGGELASFEPGCDLRAAVTVLCEGAQGYLTEAALTHFELRSAFAQTWELGVKEVWRVPGGLDRVIHTVGWPLRFGAGFREFGGTFVYPMGEDLLTIGIVVGLDYRDSALSVHDLLQQVKTHPLFRRLLDGGERVGWGAKTITSGGALALPRRLHAPGLVLAGEGAGFVNVPTLKGIHYAVETGMLAAEAAYAALAAGEGEAAARALASYDQAVQASRSWRELQQTRNMRQAFAHGTLVGGALASLMTLTGGRFPAGPFATTADAELSLISTARAASYPAPDGKLTFDKLSSVFASGNRTRDDQPSHIRLQTRVPRPLGELWVNMCPAQVYEIGEQDAAGTVSVRVTPSNCVQCGAISAKGGRLTPPEGGSGPEYELM
jgi:electron-transferring-flavoprotein dehydrogenase